MPWQAQAAYGVTQALGNAIVDFLLTKPKPAGPSPEELREEQLRQARIAEAQRAEQARLEAERQRVANLQRAARWRAGVDRSEAEMTEQLGGAFDVVRPRASTSFFGTPGNPDPADIAAELQEDDPFVGNSLADLRSSTQAVLDKEARQRADDPWNDPSVVDLRDKVSRVPQIPAPGPGARGVGGDPRNTYSPILLDQDSGVPIPGHVVRWPENPAPLINPLREPERWKAFIERERNGDPELYRNLDRLNSNRNETAGAKAMQPPNPKDIEFLFPEISSTDRRRFGPVVLPNPRDSDFLFPETDPANQRKLGSMTPPHPNDIEFMYDVMVPADRRR